MSVEDKYIKNHLKQRDEIDDYWLEVPYNQYGSRGFVDAVFSWEPQGQSEETFYEIIEVKSEAAIRGATGANEVIRQAQKMAGYFIEGQESEIVDTENHKFRLDIIDSEYNREHLLENLELYSSIHDDDGDLTPAFRVNLVSEDGFHQCSLNNLSEWLDSYGVGHLDARHPDAVMPISLLDGDKEPESETFCHRHGLEKRKTKPTFKLNDRYHIAKGDYKLFYCPKGIIEVFSSKEELSPKQIDRLGGMQAAAVWMLTAGVVESGDLSDAPGGEDMWESFDSRKELAEYANVEDKWGAKP